MEWSVYIYLFFAVLWAGLSIAVWSIQRLSSFLWPTAFVCCFYGVVHNLFKIWDSRNAAIDFDTSISIGSGFFWQAAFASYVYGIIRFRRWHRDYGKLTEMS